MFFFSKFPKKSLWIFFPIFPNFPIFPIFPNFPIFPIRKFRIEKMNLSPQNSIYKKLLLTSNHIMHRFRTVNPFRYLLGLLLNESKTRLKKFANFASVDNEENFHIFRVRKMYQKHIFYVAIF